MAHRAFVPKSACGSTTETGHLRPTRNETGSSVRNPVSYMVIAVAVIAVGRFWLVRPAPFRAAAQRGGWWLVLAVLSSLSMLVFGIGIALWQMTIWIAAAIVGAPLTWFLLFRILRDRPQPSELSSCPSSPWRSG
jgi:hypothetical protein